MAINVTKSVKHLTEDEIIRQSLIEYYDSKVPVAILYRFHQLSLKLQTSCEHGSKKKYVTQDCVINLTKGSIITLKQGVLRPTIHEEGSMFNLSVSSENDEFFMPENAEQLDNDEIGTCQSTQSLVRLNGDSFSDYLSTDRHCEIERDKDGALWIRDLNTIHGTFLNGVKLDSKLRYIIKNGNVIGLGYPFDGNEPLLLKIGAFWFFKVWELSNLEFEQRNDLAKKAMENSLIFSQIMGYLDFESLICYRKVCKLWNDEISNQLSEKGQICFKISETPSYGSMDITLSPVRRLFEKRKLRALAFHGHDIDIDIPFENQDVFTTFLMGVKDKIRHVEIGFTADHRNKICLLELTFCYRHFISTVTLSESICNETQFFDDDPRTGPITSVHTLKIAKKQHNIQRVFQFFPNIIQLIVTDPNMVDEIFKVSNNQNWMLNDLQIIRISPELYEKNPFLKNRLLLTPVPVKVIENLTLLSQLSSRMKLKTVQINNLSNHSINDNIMNDLCKGYYESLTNLEVQFNLNENDVVRFDATSKIKNLFISVKGNWVNRAPSIVLNLGPTVFPNLHLIKIQVDTDLQSFGRFVDIFTAQSIEPVEFGSKVKYIQFDFPDGDCLSAYSGTIHYYLQHRFPKAKILFDRLNKY